MRRAVNVALHVAGRFDETERILRELLRLANGGAFVFVFVFVFVLVGGHDLIVKGHQEVGNVHQKPTRGKQWIHVGGPANRDIDEGRRVVADPQNAVPTEGQVHFGTDLVEGASHDAGHANRHQCLFLGVDGGRRNPLDPRSIRVVVRVPPAHTVDGHVELDVALVRGSGGFVSADQWALDLEIDAAVQGMKIGRSPAVALVSRTKEKCQRHVCPAAVSLLDTGGESEGGDGRSGADFDRMPRVVQGFDEFVGESAISLVHANKKVWVVATVVVFVAVFLRLAALVVVGESCQQDGKESIAQNLSLGVRDLNVAVPEVQVGQYSAVDGGGFGMRSIVGVVGWCNLAHSIFHPQNSSLEMLFDDERVGNENRWLLFWCFFCIGCFVLVLGTCGGRVVFWIACNFSTFHQL
mmetsp:Transcript_11645/g.24589  ORF Transcript_11645/g.24589 Transcript_11645/m.24589 type:complete len:409 (+) Transcript_11645:903-2129(+)